MSTENPKPKDIERFFRKFVKVFSAQSESSTQQSVPDKENARHFASVFCFVALNYFQSRRIIYSFSYDEMHSKYTRPAQYNQHHTQHFYMFILNIIFIFFILFCVVLLLLCAAVPSDRQQSFQYSMYKCAAQ